MNGYSPPKAGIPDSKAERLLLRHSSLESARSTVDSLQQTLANYFAPRKANITEQDITPNTEDFDRLYDSTGVDANNVLANGQMAGLTPPKEKWFRFDPPRPLVQNPQAVKWYNQSSEILLEILGQSNFYEETYEIYLNRGAFGLANLSVEAGKRYPLHYKSHDVGSFSIAENEEGYVDTVFREFDLTLSQCLEKFGKEALSDKMLAAFHDVQKGNPKEMDRKYCIVHCVYPRSEAERTYGAMDGPSMPFASVYIDKKAKHILQNSGFFENPYVVSRWQKWQEDVYGFGPSWIALAEQRQLNKMQHNLDLLAELQVNPPILYPTSGLSGISDVDKRPGGSTLYDPNMPNAKPEEWGQEGRIDIGVDRVQMRQEKVQRIFYNDLFQLFANLDQKNMTRAEVVQRTSEKMTQFSPIFHRFLSEFLNPVLQRSFAILLRNETLPPPPASIVQYDSGGIPMLLDPEPAYQSSIALAIRRLENSAWFEVQDMFLQFQELKPELWDNINFDNVVRDGARNAGFPVHWLLDPQEVQAVREARAEAAQRQTQLEQLETLAGAAQRAGRADSNNIKQLLNQSA